jgi:hypothetical protein
MANLYDSIIESQIGNWFIFQDNKSEFYQILTFWCQEGQRGNERLEAAVHDSKGKFLRKQNIYFSNLRKYQKISLDKLPWEI